MLLALEQPPSTDLASQIEADLEWRALRGAQELATTSALALFAGDTESPLHECLDQMPKQLAAGGKTFDLRYAPVLDVDRPQRILLVISDITERVARERAERAAREDKELSALAALLATNRAEVDEFFAEVAGLVASLDAPADAETERVTVRKLKDSCAYYGLETYVGMCDRI